MIEKIEVLRQYASNPPAGSPPEILPWEPDDPWGLEGAARSALTLILDGAQPSDETFAVADYLLTFNTQGYKGRFHPSVLDGDGRLLNGTVLALFGYLYADHPEAELWRVCGCARLASVAHQRKAALEKQSMADCVRVMCDVARESDAPILADLITLEERMWGQLVDHSRAERLHIKPEDYGTQMISPVALSELGGMLKRRAWQSDAHTPDYKMQLDLEDADGICENLVTLRAHMLVRHQFGSDIDWHLRLFDDVESTVSLNAMPFIRNLVSAFQTTGDDKYAETAARILRSWYAQCPLPNHWHIQGPWRTLEVGNRQANMWPSAVATMGGHEAFDENLHAMLAHSRLDHIRYAMAFCGGANNWYQVECSGLAVATLFSPELMLADTYLRVAMRRLRWINSFAYYDDGFQFELTHGYHVFPTSSLFSVVQAAKVREVELPEDFTSLVERAHEMYLFAAQPNHILPTFNDCNPNPMDPAALLGAAAEAFDRNDFRWGASRGDEGTAPDHCSHAWDDAGLYVMRNQWGEDGQHLFFDGAPWGASHQHDDKLNFALYSHGRLLIGDPNIYSYAATELTHYFKSARAHNVVMVDGMGQMRRFDDEAKLKTKGENTWVSEDAFDFVSSEYCEAWGENRFGAEEQPELVESIVHRRAMFYVKGEYWILCDRILGEDSESHTFEQLFHPAPIFDLEGDVAMRAGEIETDGGRIVTRDEGMGNLSILPVDTEGLEITAKKGETSPAAGWYGLMGEFPAWEVSCTREGTYPNRMDAVLWPMAEGQTEHPSVERLYADERVTAFEIKGEGIHDIFFLCEEGCSEVAVDDVVFSGRLGVVRRGGDEVEAFGIAIKKVMVGEKEIR